MSPEEQVIEDDITESIGISVEDILIRQAHKKPYEDIRVSNEVTYRIESGTNPDVIRSIGKIALDAGRFFKRKGRIEALEAKQKEFSDGTKEFAATHEGFRGVISEKHNIRQTVSPRYEIKWNHDRLFESLGGAAYRAVVADDKLQASIAIPNGYETNKGPIDSELLQTALEAGLRGLGLSEEEIAKLSQFSTVTSVNESALAEMIEKGQAKLLPGSAQVKTVWVLSTPKPFNKS
ncbi:MAG: hypothetical protein ACREF5_02695 [Candidatus Saccharimonadales bacterium]